MMSMENVDTGSPEIDKRLDEILTPEERPSGLTPAVQIDDSREASPLTTLKSIVLSMDWEISDAILTEFIQELNRLKTVLKDDGILLKCLQLLEAIGKYILQKKAQTHPDSIRLLQSIYRDLEILLLSKGVSETARRNILADEITQFKRLKEKLTEPSKSSSGDYFQKAEKPFGYSAPLTAESQKQAKSTPEQETMPPHEAFLYAIEEMKKTIQAEFGAIRAELKLWRKER
jgi:hypothetical protein